MTLEYFAYRISGPIDAALNLIINTAIPWYLLRNAESIPWTGYPSAFVFVGSMVFCVCLLATFFGFRNGVLQRNAGIPPGPIAPETAWRMAGWRLGLIRAVCGLIVTAVLFHSVTLFIPQTTAPPWLVIAGNGLLAGVLGYTMQATGVLKTRNLPGSTLARR